MNRVRSGNICAKVHGLCRYQMCRARELARGERRACGVLWKEEASGINQTELSRKGTLQVTVPLVMARSCHPGLLALPFQESARTCSPAHGGPLPRLEVAPGSLKFMFTHHTKKLGPGKSKGSELVVA